MLSTILGILGVVVGAASLAFAVYQSKEKEKLQALVRAQNWHLYSKAANANGQVQHAARTYKTAHADALSPGVIESLAMGDAFGQDVLKDIVRTIQTAEPKFGESEIEGWISSGKISEHHAKEIFRKISVAS